jgi:hypothetical protein
MFYRGPNDRETRALRRLFVVKVYDGNPDVKKPKIRKEKVIAWNQCDAIRRCGGKVAELPEAECFVTWDDKPLKIFDLKHLNDYDRRQMGNHTDVARSGVADVAAIARRVQSETLRLCAVHP